MISDREIISRFKIRPKDKVLDIGGSMRQRDDIRVDTLIDIIAPEEAPYGPSKLRSKNFVRLDVTRDKLPFGDKEFDFCLCSHTLEDLTYPFLVIEEMGRVAKRGLIVTPSMGADMVFSHINFSEWLTGARRIPGKGHHKWFFYKKGKGIRIIPKNYSILYTHAFQIVGWEGEEEFIHYWEARVGYEKGDDLNIHKLIDEYDKYLKKQSSKIKKGRTLFFIDSPQYYLKELIKLLLKRGVGFKYRKNF